MGDVACCYQDLTHWALVDWLCWVIVVRSLANGKAVRRDGILGELFNNTLNGDPGLRERLDEIVIGIWRGKEVRNSGKMPLSKCSTRRTGANGVTTGQDIAGDRRLPPQ